MKKYLAFLEIKSRSSMGRILLISASMAVLANVIGIIYFQFGLKIIDQVEFGFLEGFRAMPLFKIVFIVGLCLVVYLVVVDGIGLSKKGVSQYTLQRLEMTNRQIMLTEYLYGLMVIFIYMAFEIIAILGICGSYTMIIGQGNGFFMNLMTLAANDGAISKMLPIANLESVVSFVCLLALGTVLTSVSLREFKNFAIAVVLLNVLEFNNYILWGFTLLVVGIFLFGVIKADDRYEEIEDWK